MQMFANKVYPVLQTVQIHAVDAVFKVYVEHPVGIAVQVLLIN